MRGGISPHGCTKGISTSNGDAELVHVMRAVAVVHSKTRNSAQLRPFYVISKQLKAKIRCGSRGIDENAVARQISSVFDDSLRKI